MQDERYAVYAYNDWWLGWPEREYANRQFEFIPFGTVIPTGYRFEDYTPQQFYDMAKHAAKVQLHLFGDGCDPNGEAAKALGNNAPRLFMGKGMFRLQYGFTEIDPSPDYLTIVEDYYGRRNREQKELTHRYYIAVERHKKEVDAAIARTSLNLEKIIVKQVEKGIATGVEKAVAEQNRTLESIQDERAALEKRLRELSTLEEKAAIREAKEAEKKSQRKPRSLAGYVYLLKSVTGYYKIGRTSNPDNRLATFDVKLPFEVAYEHLIQTDDMYALESELHIKFARQRKSGEWFQLTPEDIAYIKAL